MRREGVGMEINLESSLTLPQGMGFVAAVEFKVLLEGIAALLLAKKNSRRC